MNSLDKMEDYDRLARLCEKLSRDVAERDALLVEMRDALLEMDANHKEWAACCGKSVAALSKTLPSAALERALAAERQAGHDEAMLAMSKIEPFGYIETITGRVTDPTDAHRERFHMCYEPLIRRPQPPQTKEGNPND
jgi:hypothetical protein